MFVTGNVGNPRVDGETLEKCQGQITFKHSAVATLKQLHIVNLQQLYDNPET